MTRARAAELLAGVAVVAVGVSRLWARPPWPDDYDAIGFVAALDRFDLAALQPHFPGYPIYVVLGKLAHLALPALDAATSVSAVASAFTAAGLYRIGRALGGSAAGLAAIAVYAAAFLPWLLGSAALSDGTAAAFAVWSFALLCGDRPRWAGGALLVALLLGVRASYWPLAISWAAIVLTDGRATPRDRLRAAAAGVAGLALWMIPFVARVGGRPLWAIGRTHLAGHFLAWGGSVATRPGLAARGYAFARGLAYDGFAPNGWLLAAAALFVALAWRGRRPTRRAWIVAAWLVLPYALWVLFGQNVLEQPRHLLPLVIAAGLVAGLLLGASPLYATLCVLVLGAASLPLLRERRETPPAAVQAVDYVTRTFTPRNVAIFGGRSMRFFRGSPFVTRERTWLSEVDVELERLDVLPPNLLVTSEVEPDPRRASRLVTLVTLCRDPRLDRAQSCLTLSSYRIGAFR